MGTRATPKAAFGTVDTGKQCKQGAVLNPQTDS